MKKMLNIKYIITLAIFSCMFLLMTGTSSAGLAIGPTRHIVELDSGQETQIEYQMKNTTKEDIEVTIDPKYWSATEDEKTLDISSWLIPEQEIIKISAGEEKKLKIKIKAPRSVKGEIVAMIFFCYKESKNSALNIRNGNPLYLVIKDTEHYAISIDDVLIKYIKQGKKRFLEFSVSLINNGNIHIKPNITVVVKDSAGNEKRKFKLQENTPLLKGENSTYQLNWHSPSFMPDEIYSVDVVVSYEDKIGTLKQERKFKFEEGNIIILDE